MGEIPLSVSTINTGILMSQNAEEINDLHINPWPEDWDLHVAKSFQAHLLDNNDTQLCFEAAIFATERIVSDQYDIDKTILRVSFKLNARRWLGVFTYDGEYVYGDIAYVFAIIPAEDGEAEAFHAYPEGKATLLTALKSPVGMVIEKDKMKLIENVEAMILDDYWRRRNRGNDDDDNGDEPSNSPVPEGSLDLKPNIIGV